MLINCSSKLATQWFGDKEVTILILTNYQRVIATSIGGLAIPIGAIVGFAVPTIFISSNDAGEEGKSDFYRYLLTQNIIITCLTTPLLFFAAEKPPTPPSYL